MVKLCALNPAAYESIDVVTCLNVPPHAFSVAPIPSCCTSSKRTSFWVTSLTMNQRHTLQPFHVVKVQNVFGSKFFIGLLLVLTAEVYTVEDKSVLS